MKGRGRAVLFFDSLLREGASVATSKVKRRGDRVPVSEPWMPPNGGTPRQGENRRRDRAHRGRQQERSGERNMPFCETNPPSLRWKTGVINHGIMELWQELLKENGGFVLENEPTGRGIWGGQVPPRRRTSPKNAAYCPFVFIGKRAARPRTIHI